MYKTSDDFAWKVPGKVLDKRLGQANPLRHAKG